MGYNWIPWTISAVSLLFVILTYARNSRKDEDGIKEGVLKANMKLDAVCATTNETRTDIKSLSQSLASLNTRLTIVEEKMKSVAADVEELKGKVSE